MGVFSVVFQDFKLFSFLLGQNVAASVEYDSEKAVRYLDEAGFAERYAKMEKELETPLYKDFDESGVEISGGEAQKIALARAIFYLTLTTGDRNQVEARQAVIKSILPNSSLIFIPYTSPTQHHYTLSFFVGQV